MKKIDFTMVELLVVISIIMILMCILMPSLSQVKTKARSIQCTSNLKQIGLAETQYMNDNNAWTTPIFDTFPTTGGNYNWGELLALYGYIPMPVANRNTLLLCPSYEPKFYVTRAKIYGFLNYDSYYAPFKINSANITTFSSSGSLTAIKCIPSKFFYIADSAAVANQIQNYQYNNGTSITIHLRHSKEANLLFGDGHVSHKNSTDLRNNSDIYPGGFGSTF